MSSKLVALCLLLHGLSASAAALALLPAYPTVTIGEGIIVGTIARVSNQPTVTGVANAYLGVPFASPPVRFAPPAPVRPYSTIHAQAQPPACLQQKSAPDPNSPLGTFYPSDPVAPLTTMSEDCLYLNIYAPQSASPTNLKSVMFWIYGGNLDTGGVSLPVFNGSSLAVNQDIIVVAANYRLSIFGFSNSPDIPFNQQNSGFLDQRFALKWVHDNIRSFGGDPAKITIAGESAGGWSVKQLLAQPPQPLPFRAAIMQSAGQASVGNAAANYAEVMKHFGCTDLACIRAVNGTAIQSYVDANNLLFGPVEDETCMGDKTLASIVSGQFARVPTFIGTNANEIRLISAAFDKGVDSETSFFQKFGIDLDLDGKLLANVYGGIPGDWPLEVMDQMATDFVFTCPAQSLSSTIARAGRQPVWRYLYKGDFPNLRIFPQSGAYHTSEIPSVFGTYTLQNPRGPATPAQIKLSAVMQRIWAGFVRDPSAGPGWPRLQSTWDGRELGVFGGPERPDGVTVEPLVKTDLPCLVMDPILAAAGLAW